VSTHGVGCSVGSIIDRVVAEGLAAHDPFESLRRIGIDEISHPRFGAGSARGACRAMGRGEPGPTSREPEPDPMEVESARLLANEDRETLRRAGLGDDEIEILANRFVLEVPAGDPSDFVAWALEQAGRIG